MRGHESTLPQNGFRGVIARVGIATEERGCDPVLGLRPTIAGAFLVRVGQFHLKSFDVTNLVQLRVRT